MWNWIASFWHGAPPPFEISLWILLSLAFCIGSVMIWRNINPWQVEPIRCRDWYEQRCQLLTQRHNLSPEEQEQLEKMIRKDFLRQNYY